MIAATISINTWSMRIWPLSLIHVAVLILPRWQGRILTIGTEGGVPGQLCRQVRVALSPYPT
jgi:hypothetical protein